MRLRLLALNSVLLLGMSSIVHQSAFAYLRARVAIDEAEIRTQPGEDGEIIRWLRKNEPITLSDTPQEDGFYRARTRTEAGWIHQSQVTITKSKKSSSDPEPSPEGEAESPADETEATDTPRRGAASSKSTSSRSSYQTDNTDAPSLHDSGFTAHLGYGVLPYAGYIVTVNDNVATESDPLVGKNFEGWFLEIDYALSQRFFLGVRSELASIAASQSGTNGTTLTNGLKVLQVLGGADFRPLNTQTLKFDLGIKAGSSLSLESYADTQSSGNQFIDSTTRVFSPQSLIAAGRARLQWRFLRRWGLELEAGYRYHIYHAPADSTQTPPRYISWDLSGIYYGIGLNFQL